MLLSFGCTRGPGKPLAFWGKGGTAVLRKTFLHKKVGASLACSDVVEATGVEPVSENLSAQASPGAACG